MDGHVFVYLDQIKEWKEALGVAQHMNAARVRPYQVEVTHRDRSQL